VKKFNLKELIREEIKKVLSETRQVIPLKNLNKDNLALVASPSQMKGINSRLDIHLPQLQDSMLKLDLNNKSFDNRFESYKKNLINKLGVNILNAPVTLDPSETWYNKIKINDKNFEKAKENYIQGKQSWIDRETSAGRTSGLD